YYPEARLTRLWNRLVGADAQPEAKTFPMAS
ncbi:hypothetical protein HKBW3S25_01505, partial [Candidatus Hakubella thermalkaliphila]